jgi:outer membrane protein insertion porin family
MHKILFYFALSVVLIAPNSMRAQATRDTLLPMVPYEKPQEYEIGGIRVVGAQYADANSLIAISGLRVGEKLNIPGPKFSRAVKALWELRLFTQVDINQERTKGNIIFLEIAVQELPRYTRHTFLGVKKSKHDDLNKEINKYLQKGAIMTENIKATLTYKLEKYFIDKGYRNARVVIKTFKDEKTVNAIRLEFLIDQGGKVKINDITFTGNKNVKSAVLRKKMKETVRKKKLFKKSKLVREEYENDKTKIEDYYNTLGFRDARVAKDSIWRNEKGEVLLHLTIDEGNRYYFRNIVWKGQTLYDEKFLNQVLGIKKGDPYNEELLQTRLSFSQDGRDISSLYLDNGYLFFRCDPVETSIDNDSIDLEMRIYEGPQATIDRVVIKGNDRTHEHVIRRELFTRPGDKFSRADIIRSQRQIVNLGYFNQEALGINTPVNPERGTVDIEYTVEEKPSDQLELSAGYQPATVFNSGGVIGTLGVTFNNFSLRNIRNKETWNPLPQGDGQRFSIRGQTAGERFQSYNISFTEPWLGGKKPNSLTVAAVYNRISNGAFPGTALFGRLEILNGQIGFGTRLKFPDDNFIFRADVDIQQLRLNNFPGFQDELGRQLSQGRFNNFNVALTLARNSINDPIFPKTGSLFSVKAQLTPPYSLFRSQTFYDTAGIRNLYRYVEYAKFRIDAEWYATIVGKLVLKTQAKIGMLGNYTRKTPLTPFERYELGGDGLNNQNQFLNGRSIVSMRGYEVQQIMGPLQASGAGVFSKFTMELRYPISLNPQSTIFVTAFAQGGNAWARIRDYNPFDLRRSAGMGLRVFLPMFGTLGVDYGFGFDKPDLIQNGDRWTKFGRANIVLGFEPD